MQNSSQPDLAERVSAKKQMLQDSYGRVLDYLRFSVTDLCNLRCIYCMPEEGIELCRKSEILSFEEFGFLVKVFLSLGMKKLRITGGEPFVREGLVDFLRDLKGAEGLEELHITTNGVLTHKYIPELKEIGISGINLSLDTLDRNKFKLITRRDQINEVFKTLRAALDYEIPLKINAVAQAINADEIVELSKLSRDHDLEMRFIEEMPFDGTGLAKDFLWDRDKILDILYTEFPDMKLSPDKSLTSLNYRIPGFRGKVGIIAGNSRTFCSSCNRLRLSAQGKLKLCLYGDDVLDLRSIIRSGASEEEIVAELREAITSSAFKKPIDGFKAEEMRFSDARSMSTIGG